MKITKITGQVARADRYSVFVDDKYSFSLSADALLGSGLARGDEVSEEQVERYKQLSADDKVYNQALNYISIRPRSIWEMSSYLERKGVSPAVIELTLNKLSKHNYLDDKKFAESFVENRRLLRPTSRRKMSLELRKRRVADSIITEVVGSEQEDENTALTELIIKKRRQSKYQDDLKLMQYLAGQGFNYGDIKSALKHVGIDSE